MNKIKELFSFEAICVMLVSIVFIGILVAGAMFVNEGTPPPGVYFIIIFVCGSGLIALHYKSIKLGAGVLLIILGFSLILWSMCQILSSQINDLIKLTM